MLYLALKVARSWNRSSYGRVLVSRLDKKHGCMHSYIPVVDTKENFRWRSKHSSGSSVDSIQRKKNHQEVILIKFIVCVYKPQENPHKNQSRIIRFLFPRQASFVSFMSSEDFCFYHSVKNSCNVACMFLFPIQARHTHNPKRRHGDDILL
mmetsp:Transcript_25352/g.69868  ORF Transcript_25352/g.69868 Transcript_25352/m.69868 type:complete len:151 (+) Transcript_25352:1800-2252(+)